MTDPKPYFEVNYDELGNRLEIILHFKNYASGTYIILDDPDHVAKRVDKLLNFWINNRAEEVIEIGRPQVGRTNQESCE